jgi:hypothetical protein
MSPLHQGPTNWEPVRQKMGGPVKLHCPPYRSPCATLCIDTHVVHPHVEWPDFGHGLVQDLFQRTFCFLPVFFLQRFFSFVMARVTRALYRCIMKEIRGLTLSNSRIFLIEQPDHRQWGHGNFVENKSQVDVLLGLLPPRAAMSVLDWSMTTNNRVPHPEESAEGFTRAQLNRLTKALFVRLVPVLGQVKGLRISCFSPSSLVYS